MDAMPPTDKEMCASKDTERRENPRKGKQAAEQAAEQANFKSERGRARRLRAHVVGHSSQKPWPTRLEHAEER